MLRPILYSNWLSKDYLPVDQEELRDYVQARLKVFYEEELDIPLVLFNEVLDHVLRIDRIFKQSQVCVCVGWGGDDTGLTTCIPPYPAQDNNHLNNHRDIPLKL